MIISHKDNSFCINLRFFDYERDEFNNIVNIFKSLFISFNQADKLWHIQEKRIDEILLWLQKYNLQYELDDTALERIKDIESSYKRELEVFRDREFDKSILNESVTPFNYQIETINWMLKRSSCLNALDAGLGKTFCAISVFAQLYKQNEIDGIVIVVPIGLSFHWLRQILQFVNVFKEEDIQIIDNSLKIKCFSNFKDKKILIIRQDLVADTIASYRKDYKPSASLKKLKWGSSDFVNIKEEWNKNNLLLLIDECHLFNHSTAIKTKAILSIKKYFRYRLLLTATPAINEFANIFNLLKIVDNSLIKMTENAFKIWISNSIGNRWDRYAINSYNTENVQKVMKDYRHVFTQLRKEDLEEVKTKKFIKQIEFDLTPIQKKIYRKIVEKELHILEKEFDSITWRLLLQKIHIILEVFDNPLLLKKREYDDIELNKILDKWDIEDDPKFVYLKNRVEDICDIQKKKLIVYDIHPETLNTLEERFSKYNPIVIHGSLKVKDKEKDRQDKQDLFNYDPKCRIILLSLYTSSAGINLQHGSSNIIIYTLAWDATLFRQSQDRISRIDSLYDAYIEMPFYPLSLDNLRMQRNLNRVELNSKLDQELTQEELTKLLRGIV